MATKSGKQDNDNKPSETRQWQQNEGNKEMTTKQGKQGNDSKARSKAMATKRGKQGNSNKARDAKQ